MIADHTLILLGAWFLFTVQTEQGPLDVAAIHWLEGPLEVRWVSGSTDSALRSRLSAVIGGCLEERYPEVPRTVERVIWPEEEVVLSKERREEDDPTSVTLQEGSEWCLLLQHGGAARTVTGVLWDGSNRFDVRSGDTAEVNADALLDALRTASWRTVDALSGLTGPEDNGALTVVGMQEAWPFRIAGEGERFLTCRYWPDRRRLEFPVKERLPHEEDVVERLKAMGLSNFRVHYLP